MTRLWKPLTFHSDKSIFTRIITLSKPALGSVHFVSAPKLPTSFYINHCFICIIELVIVVTDQTVITRTPVMKGHIFFYVDFLHVNWALAIIRYDLVSLEAVCKGLMYKTAAASGLLEGHCGLLCADLSVRSICVPYLMSAFNKCSCLVWKSFTKTINAEKSRVNRKARLCLIISSVGAWIWYPLKHQVRLKLGENKSVIFITLRSAPDIWHRVVFTFYWMLQLKRRGHFCLFKTQPTFVTLL